MGSTYRVEVFTQAVHNEYSLLPDYVPWFFKNHGNVQFHLYLAHPAVMCTQQEGYLHFSTGSHVGTIIAPVKTALEYKNKPFVGVVRPEPGDRYFTQETCEWVLPFRIVQEIENAEG